MEKPHAQDVELMSDTAPPAESRPKQEPWRAAARPKPRERPGMPRRLHRPALLRILSVLGPGIIAASAGNDAGNIASFSSAGAKYGYSMLWVVAVVTISFVIIQVMAARLGVVTGKGFSDLVREQYGARWMAFAMGALFIANAGTVVSEFAGIAAAVELFGISRYISVPVMAVVIWWLVAKGSYRRVERIFLIMTLGFFTYLVSPFLVHTNWAEVARNTVIPSIPRDAGFLVAVVALIGSTITPYQSIFEQTSVVEKGITAEEYPAERVDAISGAIFSNIIDYFIIIATAATLFAKKAQIQTAADAAKALEPAAGHLAYGLFAVGLFGAATLAASVLPLATAFSVCEAFGWPAGVNKDLREAPLFYGLFTGLLALGAVVTLIPGLPLLQLIIFLQLVNAVLLPILLVFTTRLASNRELMKEYANGRVFNLFAWATTLVIGILAVVLIVITVILPIFGINLGS